MAFVTYDAARRGPAPRRHADRRRRRVRPPMHGNPGSTATQLVWKPAERQRRPRHASPGERPVPARRRHAAGPGQSRPGDLQDQRGRRASAGRSKRRRGAFPTRTRCSTAFKAGELDRDVVVVVRFQGPRANGMPELHKLTPALGVLQDRGHQRRADHRRPHVGRQRQGAGGDPRLARGAARRAAGAAARRRRHPPVRRTTASSKRSASTSLTRDPAPHPPPPIGTGRELFAMMRDPLRRRRSRRVGDAPGDGFRTVVGPGGEGGIRTHGRLAPTPHFECGAFDHSATSPRGRDAGRTTPAFGRTRRSSSAALPCLACARPCVALNATRLHPCPRSERFSRMPPNSPSIPLARFAIGEVVRHRLLDFRGVIFDVDPEFANSEEWYEAIPEGDAAVQGPAFLPPARREHASSSYVAYVSQQNLVARRQRRADRPSGDRRRCSTASTTAATCCGPSTGTRQRRAGALPCPRLRSRPPIRA